jgi:tetratricopeptide (TPR) repeat protein
MRRFFLLLFVLPAAVLSAQETQDALLEYRSGNFERAIEITTGELEENPNNVESHVVMGWSLNALRQYQEALDIGLGGLQISQYDHRLIQIVAEADLNLGNMPAALEYLELYVQVAPTGSQIDWVYYAMGEVFLDWGQYHRADIALTASVYHNGRNAIRWARLGYAREQLSDWQEALQAYERALQLDPDLGDAIRGRDRVESELGG